MENRVTIIAIAVIEKSVSAGVIFSKERKTIRVEKEVGRVENAYPHDAQRHGTRLVENAMLNGYSNETRWDII